MSLRAASVATAGRYQPQGGDYVGSNGVGIRGNPFFGCEWRLSPLQTSFLGWDGTRGKCCASYCYKYVVLSKLTYLLCAL